ncbi:NUDIX hydrolase [Plantactinospora soyae]|uniref:8-oxo-dGTP pyrophosphatase MutT (NUDIX family) n=1 Tax=Plantactinospora soyae TaxID=1544732 RepID=A0A927M7Z2_9ACTN|nr:NUDIX hydrolase [Plantactinospora soyae]MBE1486160.1 8-oxo-dGTP pyrophosphatase MutT (NUDIX family) [Plantactinospora soyae]
MRDSVAAVHDLVSGLVPTDELEERHRTETLHWLRSTDDVFRRVKPAVPPRHLVSYVVPVDPADGGVLLVDHVNAGLWLPPGGHVDPDEHPAETARREAYEELGVPVGSGLVQTEPVFVTVTRTVGIDAGHTDVSLWFLLRLDREQPLSLDSGEFREARWWSPAEVRDADPTRFDPHFTRFWRKLQRVRF